MGNEESLSIELELSSVARKILCKRGDEECDTIALFGYIKNRVGDNIGQVNLNITNVKTYEDLASILKDLGNPKEGDILTAEITPTAMNKTLEYFTER